MSRKEFYEEIEHAISVMKPRTRLYNIIKKEMQRRNRWRKFSRGKFKKREG